MEEIITNLKKQIIEALNLEEITVDDIETDAPLFGDGLSLDRKSTRLNSSHL